MPFGKDGLVKVTYTGSLAGVWRGPVTCHSYRCEPARVFWMDRSDAATMADYKGPEGGTLFEVLS